MSVAWPLLQMLPMSFRGCSQNSKAIGVRLSSCRTRDAIREIGMRSTDSRWLSFSLISRGRDGWFECEASAEVDIRMTRIGIRNIHMDQANSGRREGSMCKWRGQRARQHGTAMAMATYAVSGANAVPRDRAQPLGGSLRPAPRSQVTGGRGRERGRRPWVELTSGRAWHRAQTATRNASLTEHRTDMPVAGISGPRASRESGRPMPGWSLAW